MGSTFASESANDFGTDRPSEPGLEPLEARVGVGFVVVDPRGQVEESAEVEHSVDFQKT